MKAAITRNSFEQWHEGETVTRVARWKFQ